VKRFLTKLQNSDPFSEKELEDVFLSIIEQKYDDLQVAAFLFALSLKGETVMEILSLVKILRNKTTIIKSPINTIDVCGTGGDGKNTLNISTAVSFVIAACNVSVAKHGNKSVSSLSGSSDVLLELGINIIAPKEKMEQCLLIHNIAFLFAPNYHTSLANIAPIRQSLQVRTIFNLIGPLLNPANVKRQLIGVYNKKLLNIYAEVVSKLYYDRAIIVNSDDGLDEVSVCDYTNIIEISAQNTKEYKIHPKEFSIKTYEISEIEGADPQYNAQRMIALFNGKKDAYYDAVLLNSAVGLYVSGKYDTIESSLSKVEEVLSTGGAKNKLNNMKVFLQDG